MTSGRRPAGAPPAGRSPAHGFCDDEATRRLLRSRPPRQALAWAAAQLGGEVISARALRGGTSSALHLLTTRQVGGQRRQAVLRRYVRPELNAEEPDIAAREARAVRCHNSHTDSELVFLCSSGCSPVLADQALDDVGALDPGGHIDRLAGRRRALEHVMHRALALRVLGDAPQRIRVLVGRYPVEVSFPSPPPTHAADRRTHHHVPRFHFILLSGNENVTPRRLLSG